MTRLLLLVAAAAPAALLVGAEPATGALLAVVVACAAAPVVLRTPGAETTPLAWRVGVLLGTALGCGAALRTPFADLLGPMQAQVHGQGPLLLTRGALVLGALLAVPRVESRRRALLQAVVALAFLASLATQVLLPLLALVAALALTNGRPATGGAAAGAPRLRDALLAFGFAACGGLAVAVLALRSAPPAPPRSDPEAALAFLAKDNPWRALPHARAWAAQQPAPGAGQVALARVALRLGDVAEARALLDAVAAGSPDADAQAEARQILTSIAIETTPRHD